MVVAKRLQCTKKKILGKQKPLQQKCFSNISKILANLTVWTIWKKMPVANAKEGDHATDSQQL